MEKQGRRRHLKFDMESAAKAFGKQKKLDGAQITSPFHLFSVETLRKKFAMKSEPDFATDVFVWGMGAPKKPYLTKISGVPYWPRSKAWPKSKSGKPMLFLAQFCFLDSVDIVPGLPGDVLAMFIPNDESGDWMSQPQRIRFEWMRVAEDESLLAKLPDAVNDFSKSEWYGVIHRTKDFPNAEGPEKLKEPWNLPILNATKIGGLPHGIQSWGDVYEANADGLPERTNYESSERPPGRFICQLTSVQAAPEVAYPWTNRKEELSLEFDETGIYSEDLQCLFGDMGSIFVYMNEDGECAAAMEDY